MEVVDAHQFLTWARTHGIAPDVRYSEPRCLVYMPDRPHHRFWETPKAAAAIPTFIEHLLEGMDEWSTCFLWPRDGWPHRATSDRANDEVYGTILQGAGIPVGSTGAVRYEREEIGKLIAAIFAPLVFGWSVQDDFFVVPDHGRQFLQTDHHGVIHVNFADDTMIDPFVEHMAGGKYTLPDEEPDLTFKRPDWMK